MWGILAASLFFLPFNQLIAWLVLAASTGFALYHGVVTITGLACLLAIACFAWLRYRYQKQHAWAVLLEVLLLAGVVALFLHYIPGINNLKILDNVKAGPQSAPLTMYYNFDKALVPFLLYACLPTLFITDKPAIKVSRTPWLLLALSVPLLLLLAVALGGLKTELHQPAWLLIFVMANLFFVCVAEEALFRGYLQQRLGQWLGAYPALALAALIFGAVHLPAGIMMAIFATLAGIIYGLAWMWSGRLWVAVVFHFSLNLLHLIFFTYPYYQHP